VVHRELITGQDPYSAKAMGQAFVDKVLSAVREPAPAQANSRQLRICSGGPLIEMTRRYVASADN
jgi:hypothetical protein